MTNRPLSKTYNLQTVVVLPKSKPSIEFLSTLWIIMSVGEWTIGGDCMMDRSMYLGYPWQPARNRWGVRDG